MRDYFLVVNEKIVQDYRYTSNAVKGFKAYCNKYPDASIRLESRYGETIFERK